MIATLIQEADPAAISYALLLFLIQFLVYRAQQSKSKSNNHSKESHLEPDGVTLPPTIPSKLPLIGHVINYVRDGQEYFSSLCRSTPSPVFTINMANIKVSIVQPELRQHLPKIRNLKFYPLVPTIFRRALDFGEHSCAVLNEDFKESHGFGPQIARIFREEFIPNRNLRRYIEQLDGHIHDEFSKLVPQHGGINKIRVEEWVFTTVVGALGKVLWGENSKTTSPFSNPEFLRHLKIMLQNLRTLSSPVELVIDRKLLESRRFVRQELERSASNTEYPADSLLGRLRLACDNHGAAAEDWTDFQLLLLAGALPNIVGVLTWTVHHLLADHDWKTGLREEINAFVDEQAGEIDLAEIPTRCPKLSATWNEVLRYHSGFSIARYVQEDTTIANRWLLKKGTNLIAPVRPHHVDKHVWGDDVDEFRPQRFLKTDGSLDEKERRKMKMFGLFGVMCPGRFLAANIAMSFTIRFLSSVNVSTLDEKPHVVPAETTDSMVGLPTPACDPEILVERYQRKITDIKILFHHPRQESNTY